MYHFNLADQSSWFYLVNSDTTSVMTEDCGNTPRKTRWTTVADLTQDVGVCPPAQWWVFCLQQHVKENSLQNITQFRQTSKVPVLINTRQKSSFLPIYSDMTWLRWISSAEIWSHWTTQHPGSRPTDQREGGLRTSASIRRKSKKRMLVGKPSRAFLCLKVAPKYFWTAWMRT